MSQGDFSELGRWAHTWRRPLPVQAMSEAMDCASYASPARLERVRREADESLLGATIDYPLPGICEIDGLPRLEESFRVPLERSIPTLFISGTLDGRTPVSNAEDIAAGFPNARHLILGHVSHGAELLIASPEIQDVVHSFLAGEELPKLRIDLPAWTFEH
jgi:pimeloyl-ACP methyl ester carboxylesterase